jgi:hypothetical protein
MIRLGRVAILQNDWPGAAAILEGVTAYCRQIQQPIGLSWVLHSVAYVRHQQGDDAGASQLLTEALTLQRGHHFALQIAESLECAAWIASDRHDHERAARLFGAATALRHQIGAPLPLGDQPLYRPRLQATEAALDSEVFASLQEEGRAMTLDEAVDYALSESETATLDTLPSSA